MAHSVPATTPPPLVGLLLLLSATTGMVDAASILGMGNVFTANMTGNVVFLGFAAIGATGFAPAPYLLALAAFMGGALVSGRIWHKSPGRALPRQLVLAALIESALLVLAALCVLIAGHWFQDAAKARLPMIALTAGSMGFRNANIRQLKVPDLTTTVLTLTITGLVADAPPGVSARSVQRTRLAAVAMIFAGAAMGAIVLTRFGVVATLLLTGAIILAGTIAFTRHPQLAGWQRP